MRLDLRLGRLEAARREEDAQQMAAEAELPIEEARRQVELWDDLLALHGFDPLVEVEIERLRVVLVDFAVRLGAEDPEEAQDYAEETMQFWIRELEERERTLVPEEKRRRRTRRQSGRQPSGLMPGSSGPPHGNRAIRPASKASSKRDREGVAVTYGGPPRGAVG